MTVRILGKPDTLDEEGRRFDRAPLSEPLFLNSVPKSGTHLIRNILRMFVADAQHWRREYIQHPILSRSLDAFSQARPFISWGHLLFSDDAAIALKNTRHIVLVRDPYDWVLARARFYLSDEFQGSLNNIKGGAVDAREVLNMMILGVHQKAPSMLDMYTFNAVAWMGARATLVRYEDLLEAVKDVGSRRAEAFFVRLMADCGLGELPDDWRERVATGSDPKQSRTARENLNVDVVLPDTLPPVQRAMVDFAAPGLRAILGYE